VTEEIPLTRREFERLMGELFEEAGASTESPRSFRSDGSVRCFDCMFTTSSTDCFQCTYCDGCTSCTDCTKCRGCENCHESSYCTNASHCTRSQYVQLSRNCYGCTFCFGCVGLVGNEFPILNRPYPKKVYFQMVAELAKAFGLTR